MKIIKKILAVIVALVMAFTMNAPIFAATSTGTINLHTGKLNVSGVTFNIYKIMDATVSGDNVNYTINSQFTNFFDDTLLSGSVGDTTDEKAYNYLKDNVSKEVFQKKLKEYITTNSTKITSTTLNGTDLSVNKTLEASGLGYGYYAVIPTDASNTYSPMFTTLHSDKVDIYLKGKTPDVVKTVNNNEWDSAQVGDTVNFKVTSMVPNMTGYTEYYFNFTDTMTSGLTFNKDSFKVTIDGTEVNSSEYTLTEDTSNNSFKVQFKDFYTNHKADADKEMIFTYTATINKNAVTVDQTTNTANVEYGNNPDNLTKGTPDSATVVTHKLVINKVIKDTETGLAGAEFSIYRTEKQDANLVKFVDEGNGTYRVATADDQTTTTTVVSPDGGKITIKGLDADTYVIDETKAPDGYAKLKAPQSVQITTDTAVSVTETVKVENSTESWLPETGGMGTVIFTVVGAAGLFIVLSSYVFDSKKKKAK